MNRLASPIGQLKARYDVVVVGSGYGGATAACRLAQASRNRNGGVCLLERGREFVAGEFPDTPMGALRRLQMEFGRFRLGSRTGLYDMRVNDDITVVQGCGLGGTSLINAGVVIEPTDDVFADACWPEGFRADRKSAPSESAPLDLAFARARAMLSPSRVPDNARLPKYRLLERAFDEQSGPTARSTRGEFQPVEIAVRFSAKRDVHGVQHMPCRMCGDCVSGCNHSAKGTLVTNYLPAARAAGAELYCGVRVLRVERGADNWRVYLELSDESRLGFRPGPLVIRADRVILAAGSLGTTEILLRSRRHGLPLSSRLGHGFSGNGDAIVFGYNNDHVVEGIGHGNRHDAGLAPVGPTITAMIDERRADPPVLIQDGAIPGALGPVLRFTAPILASLGGLDTDNGVKDRLREWRRELESLLFGARRGALRRTMTYLVMTREKNTGRMVMQRDRLRIEWRGVGRQAIFHEVSQRIRRLTEVLGGTHVVNPLWTRFFGRRLVTVHPLGGCCMGEDASSGVVDHAGRVFDGNGGVHDGLFVCDGSVIPRSLTSNPLLTITAIAERTCDRIVHPMGGNGTVGTRKTGTPPDRPRFTGMQFSERMSGYFTDPRGHVSPIRLVLSISTDDLQRMLGEDPHRADVVGSAEAPDLSRSPLTIMGGEFHLFRRDAHRVETRLMCYSLPLYTATGRKYVLEGCKTLDGRMPMRRVWRALSRMQFKLVTPDGVIVGEGRLQLRAVDVPRMLLGARFPGARSRRERLSAARRFVSYYLGTVRDAAAWPIRRSVSIDPYRDKAHPGNPGADRPSWSTSLEVGELGARILVSGYDADGPGGPTVILSPGFGMTTDGFTLTTIDTNIKDYLNGKGYNVCLLDYRSSAKTGSARTQHTVDEIVEEDYPAAVDEVCRRLKVHSVHFIGHCVGSLSLLLALGLGKLPRVRSAICSQSYFFLDHPRFNRLKTSLRLASLLKTAGFRPVLSPNHDRYSSFVARLIDRSLCFVPTNQRCRSPVCRRILFMYGEVVLHEQINDATHDAMYDMFNAANLTTLEQMSRMVRAGFAVNAKGENIYLDPANGRNFDLPITLIQGTRNPLFRPPAAVHTRDWLRRNGVFPPELAERAYRLEWIEGYGHLDCFVGRKASEDVFPRILAALEHGEEFARRHPRRVTGR